MANKVEKLTEGFLERYLKNSGRHFFKDSDGDFRLDYARDPDSGVELVVQVERQGLRREILAIRIFPDREVSKADFAKAIMACNEWHCTRRWPKAFLYAKDGEQLDRADTARIMLEFQIDLEHGIHNELLDNIYRCAVGGAQQFWEWARKEQDL